MKDVQIFVSAAGMEDSLKKMLPDGNIYYVVDSSTFNTISAYRKYTNVSSLTQTTNRGIRQNQSYTQNLQWDKNVSEFENLIGWSQIERFWWE